MGHMSHYTKGCGTCQHWGGARQPSKPRGDRVEFDDNVKGPCYAKVWSWIIDARSNSSCAKWEKWEALTAG